MSANINILQEIKQNKIFPVYLLSGDEGFMIKGTLDSMIDMLLPLETKDFDLSILDGKQSSIKEAISHTETCPMLSDWRIVILRDADILDQKDDNNEVQLLINWLQQPLPKSSILIIVIDQIIDGRLKIVKAIQKVGRSVSFTKDSQSKSSGKLSQKVKTKFSSLGKQITPKALRELIERGDYDMYQISRAIDQTINYMGEVSTITEKEIEIIITQKHFGDIFQLTDAIGSKSLSKSLKGLHDVIMLGESIIKIHSLITRQFRLALQAKLLYQMVDQQITFSRRTSYNVFREKIFKYLAGIMIDRLPEAKELNILKQNPYAAYKIFQICLLYTSPSPRD